jgi:hypothetical protein
MFDCLVRYWNDERALTALLILIVVEVFIAIPIAVSHAAPSILIRVIGNITFSLLLLAGVLAVFRTRTLRLAGVTLVIVTIGVRWTAMVVHAPWLRAAYSLFDTMSLLAICVVVFIQIYREGPITAHRIRGAIAAYLLLALVFAFAYAFIESLLPGAYQMPAWWTRESAEWAEAFLYFSMITLTTLGYGDITAIHPAARSIVMLEAVIGQLYPAILIARLVTLQIEAKRTGSER